MGDRMIVLKNKYELRSWRKTLGSLTQAWVNRI